MGLIGMIAVIFVAFVIAAVAIIRRSMDGKGKHMPWEAGKEVVSG